MAKIVLGKRPGSFKKVIELEMLDGSKGEIKLSFVYRTRKEYAKLMDETLQASEKLAEEKPKKEKPITAEEAFEQTSDNNADFILKIVDGWDLVDEFNKDNIKELLDTFPQAIGAIGEVYRKAILEGKLKN